MQEIEYFYQTLPYSKYWFLDFLVAFGIQHHSAFKLFTGFAIAALMDW